MKNRLREFLVEDDDGGISLFILVLFIGILCLTGFAMDMAKHEVQRASLQSALDRGVLAITSIRSGATEEDAREIMSTYVNTRPFNTRVFNFVDPTAMTPEELAAYDGGWLWINPDLDNINSRTVEAAAGFPMATTFMRMAGQADLDVSSTSAAIQTVNNVEISLVLDISGTMRWTRGNNNPPLGTSRMEILKPAAVDFIRTVTDNGDSEFVTVNLVPYAGGVNIGQTAFSILTGRDTAVDPDTLLPQTPMQDWNVYSLTLRQLGIGHRTLSQLDIEGLTQEVFDDAGVVVDVSSLLSEIGEDSLDDVTPDELHDAGFDITLAHAALVGVNKYEINWSNVDRTDIDLPYGLRHPFSFCLDIDPVDKSEYYRFPVPDRGAYSQQVGHFNYYGYNRMHPRDSSMQIMEWGWCPSDETAMVYLSQDFDLLEDRLEGMLMNDGTSTYAAIKWAAAMLHPDSQWFVDEMVRAGAIDERFASWGEDPRPGPIDSDADEETVETLKYIVLMTDGNVNYDYRLDDETDPNWWHDGRAAGGSNTYVRTQRSAGRTMFLEMCDDIKEQFDNLRIFTIAFDTNSSSIDAEMRECASSTADFFQASTVDIAATFQIIAAKIEDLKLTH